MYYIPLPGAYFTTRGHSITTWKRWGGEGVKKCLFLSIKTVQAGGGAKKWQNFYPRTTCWTTPKKILVVLDMMQNFLSTTSFKLGLQTYVYSIDIPKFLRHQEFLDIAYNFMRTILWFIVNLNFVQEHPKRYVILFSNQVCVQ